MMGCELFGYVFQDLTALIFMVADLIPQYLKNILLIDISI